MRCKTCGREILIGGKKTNELCVDCEWAMKMLDE